jgi:hypothetical protein
MGPGVRRDDSLKGVTRIFHAENARQYLSNELICPENR